MKTLWYKHETSKILTTYNVIQINNTNIFITKDPLDGWSENEARKIDAWINVSDTPCNSLDELPWKCERFWFPIAEVHKWTYHHAFWIKSVLDKLVFERKDIKNIVIHCHAGVRRSPFSVFMWLTSLYGVNQASRILWPGNKNSQKSKINNLRNGGHYGELCPEIEKFYAVYNLNKEKSFESILLDFDTIAKKEVPLPSSLKSIKERKKTTKRQVISQLKKWYNKKVVVKKNGSVTLDVEGISFYGFLIKAEQLYSKNNIHLNKQLFYNWYINQLLKRKFWYNPIIIGNKSKTAKNKFKVLELEEYAELYKYPKIKIIKKDYLVKVISQK
jgi:hypothetical protein